MKEIILGMLAHVDAGKTTLTESLLYEGKAIKTVGRVDNGTAFLDTNPLEKSRGITIYSKEARFTYEESQFTLLDTPGHIDFSPEMERSLSVLDYGILVISATDGVQSHTETLWNLLHKHNIPCFLFLNKMDLPDTDVEEILTHLKEKLSAFCVDFTLESENNDAFLDEISLCGDETLLEQYLETGTIPPSETAKLIKQRKIFPVFFGSALKLQGLPPFLQALHRYTLPITSRGRDFSAKVYKITRDSNGNRLTHVKITGGNLAPRDLLETGEKVTEIRLYSGEKYQSVSSVGVGKICALAGLQESKSGDVFGGEPPVPPPVLAPVLTYSLDLPTGTEPTQALKQIKELQEEDPALEVHWIGSKKKIQIQIMGDVQIEILSQVLKDRFDLEVTFSQREIIYRETLPMGQTLIGVGHFEPLRHYAEVMLQLEPLPVDSGLQFAVDCKGLSTAHQHLVLSHLQERILTGILTNSPLTDLKITLLGGKAHQKHTEGGDFREATFRALRQGLMQSSSLLLEPWVTVEFLLPTPYVGRTMSDLQRMGGDVSPPQPHPCWDDFSTLHGTAPLSQLGNYQASLRSYSQGRGTMQSRLLGYRPCQNTASVVKKFGYDPMKDPEHPPESIFCKQGAGYSVPWEEVHQHCHCELPKEEVVEEPVAVRRQRVKNYESQLAEDKDLMEIFQRTYGKIDSEKFQHRIHSNQLNQGNTPKNTHDQGKIPIKPWRMEEEYLLVDGYNIIFAWDDLEALAQEHLDSARVQLLNQLCNFAAYRQCEVIVVFDAYKVQGGQGSIQSFYNITQVFTKEAETADMYIEKVTHQLGRTYKVRVATSDALEQRIILGHGALRLSAQGLWEEIQLMNKSMKKYLNDS